MELTFEQRQANKGLQQVMELLQINKDLTVALLRAADKTQKAHWIKWAEEKTKACDEYMTVAGNDVNNIFRVTVAVNERLRESIDMIIRLADK